VKCSENPETQRFCQRNQITGYPVLLLLTGRGLSSCSIQSGLITYSVLNGSHLILGEKKLRFDKDERSIMAFEEFFEQHLGDLEALASASTSASSRKSKSKSTKAVADDDDNDDDYHRVKRSKKQKKSSRGGDADGDESVRASKKDKKKKKKKSKQDDENSDSSSKKKKKKNKKKKKKNKNKKSKKAQQAAEEDQAPADSNPDRKQPAASTGGDPSYADLVERLEVLEKDMKRSKARIAHLEAKTNTKDDL